ncbi:crotonase/enoyl-CoA hydratase family protein [Pseudomonadales bacterium]|nr:crotonase/enoyl-CoA hydratase family protein [Pseudomonadales bacterium]MDA8952687.1 crotonase/enoyl-CoA hydratase family protein [Pseudomonadales bacterium]MDB0050050.1 crotonase/enoyl-CoA hydratase family protein [Pseudomonadales bacterium]MDB2595379.1 crotonase/enoyl-CoA hydratase family protein [Pseudomonadales bacterium]MDB2645664.1 crotonase/enoyl-CoA hydratase family protein [Pseudomonadales bacterium]
MSYSTILYEVEDNILTITLNRPEALNAFNNEMLFELMDACDKADADDDVRAIIITGAGRGFCAGADLSGGGNAFDYDSRDDKENGLSRDGGGRLTLRLYELNKPIIAAINGPAVGVGVTMTLPMDIRLASTNAKFGFVFARRGIVPEACSSYFLPRVVGISKALEWCYSGNVFPASEAMEGGLLRSLHEPEDLLVEARKIAAEIADNTSAVSITLVRHMMWKMLGADHPMEAHKIDSRGIYHRGKSPDSKEGVVSFLEKRPAEFPGKVSTDMPEFFPWWEGREFS